MRRSTRISGAFAIVAGLALAAAAPAMPMRAHAPLPAATAASPVPAASPAPEVSGRGSGDVGLEQFVDGIVAAHMREHDAPGISVSVVRDGKILFSKGYGLANVEKRLPVSGPDTLFQIGSVSKTFVWTAVMILHERGLIDLDADVNRYLKGVRIPEAFGAPVTMNDLMAHRAGFEDAIGGLTRGGGKLRKATDRPVFLPPAIPARVYPPGTRTSYSNWGATLAAKIVEDVSGVPYQQFLEKEILKPLGMNDTTLLAPSSMPPRIRDRLAIGYTVSGGRESRVAYLQGGGISPAGGMSSTASDMARWMLVHLGRGSLGGVAIMRPQTHDLMWRRAFGDRPTGADVAHGFYTSKVAGVEIFGHGGATSNFFTEVTMAPSLGGLGVYISQSSINDHTLVADLAPLVIARLHGSPLPQKPPGTVARDTAPFVGSYLNNRRVFTKFEKLLYSLGTATVAPAGDGGLMVSAVGVPPLYYAPVAGAPDTFENRHGERLVFGREKDGRVTHFSDGGGFHSYERAGFADNGAWLFLAMGLATMLSVTTLIAAWSGRKQPRTEGRMNRALSYGAPVATLLVLPFDAAFVWTAVQGSSNVFAFLANYPPFSVKAMRVLAPILCLAAIAGLAVLWPAWRTTAWGIVRRIHFTAFALSVAFLATMLVLWNVVLVPLG